MSYPLREGTQRFGCSGSGCHIDIEDGQVVSQPVGQGIAGNFATIQHANPFDWTRQTILNWDDEMGELSIDLKPIGGHIIVYLVIEDLFFEVADLLTVALLHDVGGPFPGLNSVK